jgi:perosamine synthetase
MDVSKIEALIGPRTVGIIPVHLFGLCAEMDTICRIAQSHGLWVIEDAACAFGAWYKGRHAGTLGTIGCFSFHPRKSITTGEGGMSTTEDERAAECLRSLRDHGASKSDHSRHVGSSSFRLADYSILGFNYRMTDIQAAVGCVQMRRAPFILEARTRLARRYDAILGQLPWLRPPIVPQHLVHGYQAYVCLFAPEDPSSGNVVALNDRRNRIMATLESNGIATRQGTHAPVIQDLYAEKYALEPDQYPNAVVADKLSIALPLYPQMTETEQDYVCQHLVSAYDAS